jgi:hypothetical protein
MVRRLELVYFDAGGGHRAAANALREVMEGSAVRSRSSR